MKSTITIILLLILLNSVSAQNKTILSTLPELRSEYKIELSVYVYKKTLEKYAGQTEELVNAINSFGFDNVYLNFSAKSASSDPSYLIATRKLIKALHAKNIKVQFLLISEENSYGDRQQAAVNLFNDFQRKSDSQSRFDGISFDIEPHIMRLNKPIWKTVVEQNNLGNLYWDSEKGYGKDGANSRIMQFVLQNIKEIKMKTKWYSSVYSEAIGHFYEDKFDAGELSYGGINDFTKDCDYAIVMNYTDKTKPLINRSMAEIQNAKKAKSVEIAIKVVDNGNGDLSTTFTDEGWDVMMSSLTDLCEQAKPYQSFKGIGIFEFEGIEQMWQQKISK